MQNIGGLENQPYLKTPILKPILYVSSDSITADGFRQSGYGLIHWIVDYRPKLE